MHLKAIACGIESTQCLNEAGGYRERATVISRESENDREDAFDVNFDFENNPVIATLNFYSAKI